MSLIRVVAVLLILAGALALAYGGFSYSRERTALKLGPIELKVEQRETVNLPVWAGLGAIGVGVLLLLVRGKR